MSSIRDAEAKRFDSCEVLLGVFDGVEISFNSVVFNCRSKRKVNKKQSGREFDNVIPFSFKGSISLNLEETFHVP